MTKAPGREGGRHRPPIVELKDQHYAHEKEKYGAGEKKLTPGGRDCANRPGVHPRGGALLQGEDGPQGRQGQAADQQAANIKKLEEAAATGDIKHLHIIAVGLSDMTIAPGQEESHLHRLR